MKVLMFGWEFPPFSYGGLGAACKGLATSMAEKGIEVTFVIPKKMNNVDANSDNNIKVLFADQLGETSAIISRLTKIEINSTITPYVTSSAYSKEINEYLKMNGGGKGTVDSSSVYGKNLLEEVYLYAERARFLVLTDDYDVIHAHDWLTFNAGIKAKETSGKPLIVHVHATEFDRTGGHPDERIYLIEKEGFIAADKIIAVSSLTRKIIIEKYGIDPNKIVVVHNGIDFPEHMHHQDMADIERTGKTVLFLGRLTVQKGPDQFLDVAKRVIDHDPEVRFIVAGSGDKHGHMVNRVLDMNLSNNIIFTGYLKGKDVDRAFKMADVFIMPSVSEPFGLTPLEAMRNGTPTIISKTSGVSEVVNNCFKADFWDIDMMSNMILGLLNYKPLHEEMSRIGKTEVGRINWGTPADKCIDVYNDIVCQNFTSGNYPRY